MDRYTFALLVDCSLLLFRHGMTYAVVAVVAAIIVMASGAPAWLSTALIIVAILFVLKAVHRLWFVLGLRRRGQAVEGRIQSVDEKRRSNGERRRLYRRLHFDYDWNGESYRGDTGWRLSGDVGTLSAGGRIELFVDPEHPGHALWIEEIPLRRPELIGQ